MVNTRPQNTLAALSWYIRAADKMGVYAFVIMGKIVQDTIYPLMSQTRKMVNKLLSNWDQTVEAQAFAARRVLPTWEDFRSVRANIPILASLKPKLDLIANKLVCQKDIAASAFLGYNGSK